MEVPLQLPTVPQADLERVATIVQRAFAPTHGTSVEEQQQLQKELFEIQKRSEAWGLVGPFLGHPDQNVQFFGAHTAQVKIARDWDSIPSEQALGLKDMVLGVTGDSVARGHSKVVLRKLFVAVSSLGLKLVPGRPSKWDDWILSVVVQLSGKGSSPDIILDFLAIASQEVETSDLLPAGKMQMTQSLMDAVPTFLDAASRVLTQPNSSETNVRSALKCLEAWLPHLPSSDLTPMIPTLVSLLSSEQTLVVASDTLQEILTTSALSDGVGTKILTDPLLAWLETHGSSIVQQSISNNFVDENSHSLCKLLVALGEHSASYFAARLSTPPVQHFLRLVLSYTSLPGYYGIDEEESEMTLSFWYTLQEALWTVDFVEERVSSEEENLAVANAVYSELIVALRRKVTWPREPMSAEWTKDRRDKFQVYRRDVGDTLINAYYILRDDMMQQYVTDLAQLIITRQNHDGWEDIEANLHCLKSIQEAVPLSENPSLLRLFSSEVLYRLPIQGYDRVRSTMLALIGAYASWFTVTTDSEPLMIAMAYVVNAFSESNLSLQAANALRDLCDANRSSLAPHMAAFGELHATLHLIPDTERNKVLQSITSVIQALSPAQAVQPLEAVVSPVVQKLSEALGSTSQLPEEARILAISQLDALTGCARGLTRAAESIFVLEDSAETKAEMETMQNARLDPRMVHVRDSILAAVRATMQLWSLDASIADSISDLFKSITALPADTTLLSLPPGPLLQLVCAACQRQQTAVWLSLASILVVQLDPPSLLSLKAVPSPEAQALVTEALAILVQTSLNTLGQGTSLLDHPDIVQAFFSCLDIVVQHFPTAFYRLPPGVLDTLIACACSALSLNERYSLVQSCGFLITLLNRTITSPDMEAEANVLMEAYGYHIMEALLAGFAGRAPRSTVQNLVELLSLLATKRPVETKKWVNDIMFSDQFVASKATPEAKEKFVKAITGSRSIRRLRDAAQQFAMVARGLEGSGFGYATVSAM